MKPHRPGAPKTNLTSLAAVAAIVGLVAWMTGHATMSDSIYANDHPAAAAASPAPAHSPAANPNLARAG
jgi:hypothetical protein